MMNYTRRQFLKDAGTVTMTPLLVSTLMSNCSRKEKLNVLWLIAEDLGPDLSCYGTRHVQTPRLNQLAKEGVQFTNAFTTAPVCSASRSAFMTGMYQTSIDAHHHRSHRDEDDHYPLPEPYHVIMDYFRQAGYFTCNCSGLDFNKPGKRDWNFTPQNEPFDGTDWRQREEDQPFFAQINFGEVHRMHKRPERLTVDPNLVDLPPYYPDHPITRHDWAEYLSTIEILDEKIGKVLNRLKEDGLEENTVVFFFGDNGRNHVRGKQWLYDGGIHIPLIVRWPGKLKSGKINDDLVSAIDFAPTCLDLAGVTPPGHLEGSIFLGSHRAERKYVIAARDRCDETVDRIRCVRTKQFKYIRNYHSEKPYTQYNRYKDAYYPVLRLMHRLHAKGQLTPEQALFMADRRPEEELYDLQADPHELHNLAKDPEHQSRISRFRTILNDWIENTADKGQFPEDPNVVQKYKKQMKAWAQDRVDEIYRKEKEQ